MQDIPSLRQIHQSRTGHSFGFEGLGLEASFGNLLWDIRTYVELIELFCARISRAQDLAQLATYRNLIQYRLLSIQPDTGDERRQVCRLGALIFSYGVVYPLPDRGPLDTLTAQLKGMLQFQEILDLDNDVLLWLNMIAVMAAVGTSEMDWLALNLAHLSDAMQVRSWQDVRKLMHTYLWSDQACNKGGSDIWQCVAAVVQDNTWREFHAAPC